MSIHDLRVIIEGLIFLSGDEGVQFPQLCSCIQEYSEDEIKDALTKMLSLYKEDTYGFQLVNYGGIYKFVSKDFIHPYAEKLFSTTKVASLSNAAIETLAIIAYKQPITRVEIEEIRGVSSDNMIRKLLARNLIQECGRSDAPGKPFLYSVTNEFMDSFQLESLKELPELHMNEETQELFKED